MIVGGTTWGMADIRSYEAGFWLRLATGIGSGSVYGACTRAVVDWFPPKERGTAFGIIMAKGDKAYREGIKEKSLLKRN